MEFLTHIGIIFAVGLFVMMLLCLELGRRVGGWHSTAEVRHITASINLTETAMFALMGLLIAFTFAGANAKFDLRRQLIVDETNAIHTAYLRIDLLPATSQPSLRESFHQYVDARVKVYQAMPDIPLAEMEVEKSSQIQKKLWGQAVAACKQEPSPAVCMLVLPAINNMIDLATSRIAITKLHPPFVIFALLVGLALISSFLTGYSMARYKERSVIHVFLYAALIAITVYVVIDIEYPRLGLGLVQLHSFDELLSNLKIYMN